MSDNHPVSCLHPLILLVLIRPKINWVTARVGRFRSVHHYMLDTVAYLSPFGVVEAVNGTNKVTGNPPDTLKLDTFADNQSPAALDNGHVVNQFHFLPRLR